MSAGRLAHGHMELSGSLLRVFLSPTRELCRDQNTLEHGPCHVCSFTHAFPCIMRVMMATYSPAAPHLEHAPPKTPCVG